MKMYEGFALNFDGRETGYCIMTTHHLTLPFLQGNFYQKQHDWHPPPTRLT
jgi:hypothetical protein